MTRFEAARTVLLDYLTPWEALTAFVQSRPEDRSADSEAPAEAPPTTLETQCRQLSIIGGYRTYISPT